DGLVRPHGRLLLLPDQEPRRLRRRRRGVDARRGGRRAPPPAPPVRLDPSGLRRTRGLELATRRAPGPDPAGEAPDPRRGERPAARDREALRRSVRGPAAAAPRRAWGQRARAAPLPNSRRSRAARGLPGAPRGARRRDADP